LELTTYGYDTIRAFRNRIRMISALPLGPTSSHAEETFPDLVLTDIHLKGEAERELRITFEIVLQYHEMQRCQAAEKGLQDRLELVRATAL
jgi:hypothetical protein